MFSGDNDGSSGMLLWVCVLGGLLRKTKFIEMKEKKMKRKVRDVRAKAKKINEKSGGFLFCLVSKRSNNFVSFVLFFCVLISLNNIPTSICTLFCLLSFLLKCIE